MRFEVTYYIFSNSRKEEMSYLFIYLINIQLVNELKHSVD